MIYLSGTISNIPEKYRHKFGYMLNVNRAIGEESSATKNLWMLDNGAFSEKWNEDVWRSRMEILVGAQATCIGSVVPDVILDAEATKRRWKKFFPYVKSLGYKAFFATQNGCTIGMVPWDEIDGLFVGGNDDHRREECWLLIRHAKSLGLWVHVGRVNSYKNILRYCRADSVDGTHFCFNASEQRIKNILRGVDQCNQEIHGQLSMLDSWQQHML